MDRFLGPLLGSIKLLSEETSYQIRYWLLLIISVSLMAVGAWLYFTSDAAVLTSGCTRSGAVLFAVWIAMPQLRRFRWTGSMWVFLGLAVSAIVLAVRPKLMLIVGPILLLMGAIQFIKYLFAPMPQGKAPKKAKPRQHDTLPPGGSRGTSGEGR